MDLFSTLAVDEQRARALPQAGTDAAPTHFSPSSSTPPPGPSTENSTNTHAGPSSSTAPPGPFTENSTKPSNSSGLAASGRKRKRSTENKLKKVKKSQHKTKKGNEAKKKPNKRRKANVHSDTEASVSDSDSDSGVDTQDEHSGEGDDDDDDDDDDDEDEDKDEDDDEVVPQTMAGKSTRKTSMDPRRWKDPKAPVNADVDTIKINVNTALPSSSNASALPSPPAAHPSPLPPVDALVVPSCAPSVCSSSLLETIPSPSSNESTSSLTGAQADPAWPSWFKDAHQLLSGQNLGREFTSLINHFTEHEKRTDFAPGARSAGFGSDNRPPEVHYWISRGRTIQPKVSNVVVFQDNWWKWWKGLQPTWRAVSEVEGPLDRSHRRVSMGGQDWSAVNKHGRNAFFTVLATLFWWGVACSKPPTEDPGWMATVEDVGWVFDGLLGVQ